MTFNDARRRLLEKLRQSPRVAGGIAAGTALGVIGARAYLREKALQNAPLQGPKPTGVSPDESHLHPYRVPGTGRTLFPATAENKKVLVSGSQLTPAARKYAAMHPTQRVSLKRAAIPAGATNWRQNVKYRRAGVAGYAAEHNPFKSPFRRSNS